MKTRCTILASALAAILRAAVPLAWEARPGQPAPVMFDRFHGETLELTATLRGFGVEPFADGADIRLWYQTNGMGQAWWSAPATVASNVLTAVWSPEMDPGAERVSLFFGAPSNAYAAAVLRLRHSPGFAPANPPPLPSFAEADPLFVAWLPGFAVATNDAVQAAIRAGEGLVGDLANDLRDGSKWVAWADNAGYALNADNAYMLYLGNRLVGAEDLIVESTNAAVAVADAKISTNNPAFVTAVLTSPLVGADPSDLSELAEYGSYGTVGAAILALIAGLAALKRRMTAAETAIDGKADVDALPYSLVVPGEWQFSGDDVVPGVQYSIEEQYTGEEYWYLLKANGELFSMYEGVDTEPINTVNFSFAAYCDPAVDIVATRVGAGIIQLADRAVNAVDVSSATTLALPVANPGHARDLYVRLTVSATSAVTWTVAQGESWDAMGAPPSSFAAGTSLYRFREVAPGVWHCEDMLALVGLEAALAAINGGVAP